MKYSALSFKSMYVLSSSLIVITMNAEDIHWKSDFDGIWSSDANWTSSYPRHVYDSAIFPDIISSERKISILSNIQIGDIIISSAKKYQLKLGTLNVYSSIKAEPYLATHTILSNICLNNDIYFDTIADLQVMGNVYGAYGIIKAGEGALIFSQKLNYLGKTEIQKGGIVLLNDNCIPNSSHIEFTTNKPSYLSIQGKSIEVSGIESTVDTSSKILLQGGNLTINCNNRDSDFYGSIEGFGNLIKKGSGKLLLNGVNSFKGKFCVEGGGCLVVSNDQSFGDEENPIYIHKGELKFENNTQSKRKLSVAEEVRFNTEKDLIFEGEITGPGKILKLGKGELFLFSKLNSYEGDTQVAAGTLSSKDHGSFSKNSKIILENDAILSLNGFDNQIKSLEGSGIVNLGEGNLLISNPQEEVFKGSIKGSGQIIKEGKKTFFLASDRNFYSGKTLIKEGSIMPLYDDALSALSTHNLGSMTFLDTNKHPVVIGGLEGEGCVYLNGENLTLGFNNEDTQFNGRIYGDAGLIKVGSGIFSLGDFSTHAGATIIDEGVFRAAGENVLSKFSEIILSDSATLDLHGNSNRVANIAGSGTILLDSAALTFGNENTTGFHGTLKGNGFLVKTGSGGLIIYGNQDQFTGDIKVEKGFIRAGSIGSLSENANFYIAEGATVDLNNFDNKLTGLSGEGELKLGSAKVILDLPFDRNFSGKIEGSGCIEKIGSGNLTLSKTINYQGDVKIKEGGLVAGCSNVFSNQSNLEILSKGEGKLDIGPHHLAFKSILGDGEIYLNGGSLSFGDDSYKVFSGKIKGKGDVYKDGPATFVLKGSENDYEGTTHVRNGKLISQNTNSFSKNSSYLIYKGARLDISGNANQILSVEGDGNLHLGAGNLTLLSDSDYLFSGSITSMKFLGNLTKDGNGTFAMNSDSSYWGVTNVMKGCLKALKENAFSPNSKLHITSGGRVELNGFNNKVSALQGDEGSVIELSGKKLTIGGSYENTEFKGNIIGAGILSKTEGGELLLSGKNEFSGNIEIEKDGVVGIVSSTNIEKISKIISRQGTFKVHSNTTLDKEFHVVKGSNIETDYEFVLAGNLCGEGILSKKGKGNLYLTSSDSTFVGDFVISEGNVYTNSKSFFSKNTNLIFSSNLNPTVTLNQYNQTLGGLSGNGNIITAGSDILIQNQKTNNFSGKILNAKNFTKQGSGSFNLLSDQALTGSLLIHEGLFSINSKLDGDVVVFEQARLGGSGVINKNVTVYGVMAPGNSIGTITVAGNYTQASGSTYENEINPTQTDYLNVNGTISIQSPTTLKVIADSGYYSNPSNYIIAYGLHGINGTFTNVTTNIERASASLSYTPSNHPKYINLIFNLGSYESVAVGNNNINIANAIDKISAKNQSSWIDALNALFFLNNNALNSAYNSIGPTQYRSFAVVAENNSLRVRQSISLRFQNLLDQVQCKYLNKCFRKRKKAEFWVDGLYANLNQYSLTRNKNKQVGYNSYVGGGSAGLDLKVSKFGYLGIMGAGTSTSISLKENHGAGDIYSGYFAPYASYIGDNFFMNSSLLVGFDVFKMRRDVEYSGFVVNPKSQHRGTELLAHLDIGWNAVFKTFTVRPFESVDFSWLHEKGFSEMGGSNYNLDVSEAYPELFRNELGLNFANCTKVSSMHSFMSDFKVSWVYESRFNARTIKSYFLTNRDLVFNVSGYFPSRSLASFAATFTANLFKETALISVNYDTELGYKYFDQMIQGQIGFRF
jgi:autotransporter-associated beta strand protein